MHPERAELMSLIVMCSSKAHIALAERNPEAAGEWIEAAQALTRQLDGVVGPIGALNLTTAELVERFDRLGVNVEAAPAEVVVAAATASRGSAQSPEEDAEVEAAVVLNSSRSGIRLLHRSGLADDRLRVVLAEVLDEMVR